MNKARVKLFGFVCTKFRQAVSNEPEKHRDVP
jgi:hypothetical protein